DHDDARALNGAGPGLGNRADMAALIDAGADLARAGCQREQCGKRRKDRQNAGLSKHESLLGIITRSCISLNRTANTMKRTRRLAPSFLLLHRAPLISRWLETRHCMKEGLCQFPKRAGALSRA